MLVISAAARPKAFRVPVPRLPSGISRGLKGLPATSGPASRAVLQCQAAPVLPSYNRLDRLHDDRARHVQPHVCLTICNAPPCYSGVGPDAPFRLAGRPDALDPTFARTF